MMIRAIAEKDHALLIAVGYLEAHELGPKLYGSLDITDSQDEVIALLYLYRRCHIPSFFVLDFSQ